MPGWSLPTQPEAFLFKIPGKTSAASHSQLLTGFTGTKTVQPNDIYS
jgi:hypothetical protein